MSFSEWKEVELEEVISFNPRESLKKGTIAKKIGMDKLEPFNRKIQGFEETEFKSGTKFRNGDTLLARITPCLENGKTAQVRILDKNEIGFGSTEFIVMREKADKTINDFIYYLAISKEFRNIAIKSMTGTSGRQRAQKDVLEKTVMKLPIIEEQKAIAHILSILDEKMEINNQINKKLEEMAQAIFKQWFVDFEFPNEEGEPYKSSGGEMVESELGMIPKGWEVSNIGNLCDVTSSKRIFMKEYSDNGVPFYRSKEVIEKSKGNNISTELFISKERYAEIKEKFGVPSKNDILLTSVGTLGVSYLVGDEEFYFKDGNLTWFKDFKNKCFNIYIFNFLISLEGKKAIDSIAIGSTQKALTINSLKQIKIIKPSIDIINKFHELSNPIIEGIRINIKEKERLMAIRDTLLPKLMSGEIRVPLDN
ncbi:restriction endonuclease subunit S [Clostridium sp. ZS2-4]|uniref:restriction endonuclease subunit S n=1 Tax=Clostridium sp. ZS2-4 TaxID=2987703 RepID=UPI00227CE8C6|nr:restriction endonuclease subunit S [Clostridium sp. ZS2-4]MCY6354378.1 restriction endonuclease subunit S [Clostridium sp. ZS2-4]